MDYYWLIQSTAYWSLTLFIVPYKYIKRLFPFGFLGGFIYTWIVQYTAVQILNLWRYTPTFLTIYDIPFFFVISWFGVTLLYGYFLINYSKYQVYVITFFVSWTTFTNYFANQAGVFAMTNWSLSLTLMFAVFSHIFLLYLLKLMNGVEDIGTKKDMLNLKDNDK
ncbi:hypothetical protein [Acetohalobium arabaticum]|uniref:Uncharacterized protein n=1 Tax=Acetohalobium arabaticum (strain ATCC 49924 / DSM 5501 / Z-7288) TaxID=574087 RepID=D9QQH1_ACEAZ|nr:hypothetical protein [Acetohalobium arabaticum]ADL12762.1 conserved hypothetical protein [Acetohalobium arabaticum DSM 5501]